MIVTAPDGTPVAIFIGPSGFSAGFLQGITSYPFLYLNDPTCTTKPYLSATTVPVRGWNLLADPTEAASPSGNSLVSRETLQPNRFTNAIHARVEWVSVCLHKAAPSQPEHNNRSRGLFPNQPPHPLRRRSLGRSPLINPYVPGRKKLIRACFRARIHLNH